MRCAAGVREAQFTLVRAILVPSEVCTLLEALEPHCRHLPELWDDSSLLPGGVGMIETSPSQGIEKSIRMMILAIYHPKPFFKICASGFFFFGAPSLPERMACGW